MPLRAMGVGKLHAVARATHAQERYLGGKAATYERFIAELESPGEGATVDDVYGKAVAES